MEIARIIFSVIRIIEILPPLVKQIRTATQDYSLLVERLEELHGQLDSISAYLSTPQCESGNEMVSEEVAQHMRRTVLEIQSFLRFGIFRHTVYGDSDLRTLNWSNCAAQWLFPSVLMVADALKLSVAADPPIRSLMHYKSIMTVDNTRSEDQAADASRAWRGELLRYSCSEPFGASIWSSRQSAISLASSPSGTNLFGRSVADVVIHVNSILSERCISPPRVHKIEDKSGRILCTIMDMMNCSRWLARQANEQYGAMSFWGNESASFTDVSSDKGQLNGRRTDWQPCWEASLPQGTCERHFATRAICVIAASFRPLRLTELFAASTTKLFSTDPEWPAAECTYDREDLRAFSTVCGSFLEVTEAGFVAFKPSVNTKAIRARMGTIATEGKLIMALVMLKHIQLAGPQIVLRPWFNFSDRSQNGPSRYLHRYVTSHWQEHYRDAEPLSIDLAGQLHDLVEEAWLMEIAELSECQILDPESLQAYDEAANIGFVISESFGFGELKKAYDHCGASSGTHSRDGIRSRRTGTLEAAVGGERVVGLQHMKCFGILLILTAGVSWSHSKICSHMCTRTDHTPIAK